MIGDDDDDDGDDDTHIQYMHAHVLYINIIIGKDGDTMLYVLGAAVAATKD